MGALSRFHCVFIFLPQCFVIAPSVFLFFFLSVFLYETMKLKMKHKYTMFHLLNALIINSFELKSET